MTVTLCLDVPVGGQAEPVGLLRERPFHLNGRKLSSASRVSWVVALREQGALSGP
jgi:hypothetical protein